MSNLLVLHQPDNHFTYQKRPSAQLLNWKIYYREITQVSSDEIENIIKNEEIFFLVFSKKFDHGLKQVISEIKQKFPLLKTFYYFPQLENGKFSELARVGIDYWIIGDTEQLNLFNMLENLWHSHWKRVPDNLIPNHPNVQTERTEHIRNLIETKPIWSLTTHYLAGELNISESYFRTEFKKYFGRPFREFKQKLFHHYETVLLLKLKIKPKEIYEILNYNNVSAFSRSFKLRHGKTWQQLVKG